jgi:cytoskeletal protein CcmA (bactofilin family)
MFLNRKRHLMPFLSRDMKEQGSALLGVLGVMGVTTVIAVTITTASLHALGFTTATRAGVEAEAAAEAGVDFAAASLASSTCQASYSSNSAPIFSVNISYSTLPSSPGDTDNSWVAGCPVSIGIQRLKLVSTGWATDLGVANNSSQNVRQVEAIYPYTPTPPSYIIIPSGPATYSYSQSDPTINNLTITQGGATKPSMVYLSGSATCTSHSQITGDVILGGGGLSITSGCTINGDLYTSGVVSVQSGEIIGNVNAAGVQSGTSVTLATPAVVDGNIYAAGPVSISGKVGGNIVSGPVAGVSTFSNKSSVGGSVVTAGTVSAAAGSIKGTTSTNQSGIITPIIPFAPPWVDYPFSAADWIATNGTPYTVLSMATCSSSNLSAALITTKNSPVPIILDTRICGAVTNFSHHDLMLTSDTVLIANGFNFQTNNIQASSAPDRRLWIIIPDSLADGLPTCSGGSSASLGQHVEIGPHVATMIYSPCAIDNGGDTLTGQMYSSSISTSSDFQLNFIPIGLPTVNLSTGQHSSPSGTGVLGDRTSIRDLVMG